MSLIIMLNANVLYFNNSNLTISNDHFVLMEIGSPVILSLSVSTRQKSCILVFIFYCVNTNIQYDNNKVIVVIMSIGTV